ncbi:Gp15 family bacteriophage protein [Ruminococcus sp.]|uniref:Gp15 family bacteriophage protein n=1 Tax=Ruminococcus sp. TaxID=41978 RepID=UPI003AB31D70
MEEDWTLIESSFFKQYGIRLRVVDDMPYSEFCSYLSGLMPDTPLGRIAQIRAEDDKEVLKNFTDEQKRIRSEWRNKVAQNMPVKDAEQAVKAFEEMFRKLAKGGI